MQFRAGAAILSLAFLARGAIAALTSVQVVSNIELVTTTSNDINTLLGGLTTSSSPATVKAISQNVVVKFTSIITSLSQDVTAMQATPPFSDIDAGPVVTALNNFVLVHQRLLSTVIGKQSIFAQFVLTAPIAGVLRSLEGGIDTFALAMIALIPTRKGDVKGDQTALDGSVTKTINTYTEICVPSIFYPTFLPTCIPLTVPS